MGTGLEVAREFLLYFPFLDITKIREGKFALKEKEFPKSNISFSCFNPGCKGGRGSLISGLYDLDPQSWWDS